MTADANIVIGVKGDLEGGKRIKRTLDDIDKSANQTLRSVDQLDTGFNRTNRWMQVAEQRLKSLSLAGKQNTDRFKRLKTQTDNYRTALQKAERSVQSFDKQTVKANRTARLFGRALGAIGGVFAVRALGRVSDEFTVVDTSIKNVTDSTAEYDRVFGSLFTTAQNNGDVFSGLVSTYQKLAVSVDDNIQKSIDLTKVVDILSRGFAASGTNAQTAAGASLQLTQGLATNFQAAGQELNSIIEGAPLLAKAIAVELGGKSAVDLKKFAEEGTLTQESFLRALIAAEDAVKAFEIPSTIGRSVQRVRNEFLKLAGESETMRAVSVGVAEGFNFVAANLDNMFKIMAVGFGAFAGYILATQGLAAAMAVASGAVGVFNAVVLANPLALFVAAIAAAGVAVYVFRDDIRAALIQPITEVILFVDEAIRKLREFKNFATDGLAAASIGAQNAVGLIDDDVAQIALAELGGKTEGFFDAEALRGKAAGIVAGLKNKDTRQTSGFTPSGSGGSGGIGGSGNSGKKGKISQEAKDLQKIIEQTRTEQEGLLSSISNLNKLKSFAKTEEEVNAIDRALMVANQELLTASDTIPGLEDGFSKLRDGVDGFASSAGDAFGEIITGASSAKDAISDLLRSTASQLASDGLNGVIGGLLNGFGGGGGGLIGAITGSLGGGAGGILSSVGSLFGFNSGGDMTLGGNGGIDNNVISLNGKPIANTSRGETMSIRPAGTSGSNSGGVNVYQTINVSTGVQETVQTELMAFLPVIEKTTKAAIMQDKQRGIS